MVELVKKAFSLACSLANLCTEKRQEKRRLCKASLSRHFKEEVALEDEREPIERPESDVDSVEASICESDCPNCYNLQRQQRAVELNRELRECDSGDANRLRSIKDKLVDESFFNVDNVNLYFAKESRARKRLRYSPSV